MKPTEYQPLPILGDPAVLFAQTSFRIPKHARPETHIKASSDLKLVVQFLKRYESNVRTVAAYRAELERLMHWSWHVNEQSLLDNNDQDLLAYLQFSKSPPTNWIGTAPVPRFIELSSGKQKPNSAWRPYVAKLPKKERKNRVLQAQKDLKTSKKIQHPGAEVSDHNPTPATLIATKRVLSAFYKYLLASNKISVDYVKLMAQTKGTTGVDQTANKVMKLDTYQWNYVIETTQLRADEKPTRQNERDLFVMSILFSLYLRISELVHDDISKPMMSDFSRDANGHWWLQVLGKNNKERRIPVSESMLESLVRYRQTRALSPYPEQSDIEVPLVAVIRDDSGRDPSLKGKQVKEWYKYVPVTSTRAIRRLVQRCFDLSYDRMVSEEHVESHEAELLKEATVHWLRHTGISEDIKANRDPRHVQKDAGHATMATTNRYIDIDETARHESARKKDISDIA